MDELSNDSLTNVKPMFNQNRIEENSIDKNSIEKNKRKKEGTPIFDYDWMSEDEHI